MAVICNTCGLPDDLCACGDLDKDSNHIIIRLETRRFKKKGTMIEGLDPKINNLEKVAKITKIVDVSGNLETNKSKDKKKIINFLNKVKEINDRN